MGPEVGAEKGFGPETSYSDLPARPESAEDEGIGVLKVKSVEGGSVDGPASNL